MTSAAAVLDIAREEIGTREAANGSNPYGRAYGVDRVAWCAQFTWWCFRQAGAADLTHPKTAYTPTLYDWYRGRGQASGTPRVGDLVFFDWPDSVRRIQHVGLVEAVEPNAIVTIEGNTSSGTAGSQSDGGGVWRRRRARNASIVGYGHPRYTAAAPARPAAPAQEDDDMGLTPAQATQLSEIHAQLLSGWPGWEGGTGETFTPVDYLRRNDTQVSALHRNLNEGVHAKLDALLAARAAGPAQQGGLTADDVRQILREALADLGPLHLTAKEATS